MKALVTGGGGFLGRAIVEMLLGRGDQVRFMARNHYPKIEALGAEGIQGDIRDLDVVVNACMGMDAVFHTAAKAGIWGDYHEYHEINVKGTQNVMTACQRRGVGRLVYTSSPSVVFNMMDECGIDETAPYPEVWYNPYSETKAIGEKAVLLASGKNGLLSCSLRPHLIWGPRDNHLIPRLIERARKGILRKVGLGKNKVDLTYIDNAAMAHLLACDAMSSTRVAGEAYFISDDNPVVLWDWFDALFEHLAIPKVRKRVPAWMAYGVGYCLEQKHKLLKDRSEPLMTRFLARALTCSHYYNIGKAKRDFKYRPGISNKEGLRRTVEHFRT